MDGIPYLSGAVGNVLTMADAGVIVRLGRHLAIDYGPPHVRPSLAGLAAVEFNPPLAWYLFAGLEGRAVLHDIFLDGNTFADSHEVHRRTLVGDALLGIAVAVRGVRLAFTHVLRTREFDRQRRADHYGALSLSVHF
ncbi:MAG: lipid A deacylase LpxR family protein [Alphaproteobacteria bacterium]|nr:lipid A deacylase LpxR family protein [Alphaproteobacteria bacterium]